MNNHSVILVATFHFFAASTSFRIENIKHHTLVVPRFLESLLRASMTANEWEQLYVSAGKLKSENHSVTLQIFEKSWSEETRGIIVGGSELSPF